MPRILELGRRDRAASGALGENFVSRYSIWYLYISLRAGWIAWVAPPVVERLGVRRRAIDAVDREVQVRGDGVAPTAWLPFPYDE
jgi:hypothetical protein